MPRTPPLFFELVAPPRPARRSPPSPRADELRHLRRVWNTAARKHKRAALVVPEREPLRAVPRSSSSVAPPSDEGGKPEVTAPPAPQVIDITQHPDSPLEDPAAERERARLLHRKRLIIKRSILRRLNGKLLAVSRSAPAGDPPIADPLIPGPPIVRIMSETARLLELDVVAQRVAQGLPVRSWTAGLREPSEEEPEELAAPVEPDDSFYSYGGPYREWGAGERVVDLQRLRKNSTPAILTERAKDRATLELAEPDRPRTRGECCPKGFEPTTRKPRPEGALRWWTEAEACPWASCAWNLRIDVSDVGTVKQLTDVDDGRGSCALDFAEAGGMSLESIGGLSGVTRERIRQIEVHGLMKLRGTSEATSLR